MKSRIRPLPLLLLPLLPAGCVGEPPVMLDLTAAMPSAETFTETPAIDIGERIGRTHLVEGWLPDDERWARRPEESFVWATGRDAAFRFFVFEGRDLVMTIRARPNPDPDAEPLSTLGIEVNGMIVARPEVGDGWRLYRFPVPRQALRRGENSVRLIFADGAGAEAADRRLAVERVDIERTLVRYPVRPELGEPALVVPYLAGVWYGLPPGTDRRLRLDETLVYGPPTEERPGFLEIVLESDEGAPERVQVEPGEGLDLALPDAVNRIGLMAIPSGDANARLGRLAHEEAVGLLLRHPRVVGGD